MAGHLKLFGLLLNLILGVILFVFIYHQKKRYYQNILNSLMIYTFSLIIGLAALFVSKYWDMNVTRMVDLPPSSQLGNISLLTMYIILTTTTYSVIFISFQFQNIPLPSWFKAFSYFSFGLIIATFLLYISLSRSSTLYQLSDFILENYGIVFILIELLYLVKLIIRSKKEENILKRKTQTYFSLIFISRYLLIVITILIIPGIIRGFIFILLLHGSSFLWIKYSYLPYLKNQAAGIKNLKAVDQLNKMFKISMREKEILTLILQGKNNREIEDLLFISYNTVKNHVYSIYKKMGIKNRFQLFKYTETLK